jgi:hypothetical protein
MGDVDRRQRLAGLLDHVAEGGYLRFGELGVDQDGLRVPRHER